ncbi:MAG: hypothetical protein J7L14_00575, partial [Candidatus Diapherotrites archaeon]|nr:hypothetical protein [Candidatus Diapherotrites archaeon]
MGKPKQSNLKEFRKKEILCRVIYFQKASAFQSGIKILNANSQRNFRLRVTTNRRSATSRSECSTFDQPFAKETFLRRKFHQRNLRGVSQY